jgi:hypothetical protein
MLIVIMLNVVMLERHDRDKHSCLLRISVKYGFKSFIGLSPGVCIIKIITAVIHAFRNKLKCLSLNFRLSWKGLPGTNTLSSLLGRPVGYGFKKFY